MKKSSAFKKELANKNNNATGGNSNNGKASSLKDDRPLRDANFMRIAKQKLLKFLETTDYPRKFDACMFNKLTQSDVKSLFEHFITLIDSDFRLNDSQTSPEERILNFFNTIQYKNNLSKTHITSPTIVSSAPFVIGAFDFLRRFVTTFISSNPSMFFPRLTDQSISSEIVLRPLMCLHKKIETEKFLCDDLIELQDLIAKEIGVKSNEEIDLMSKQVDKIEELLENMKKSNEDIESITSNLKDLTDSIETEDGKYEAEERLDEEIQLKIREEESNLESLMQEKSFYDCKKAEYEEIGYGDKINRIEDFQQKVITIRSQYQQLKLEMEALKQTSKATVIEIDQVKLQSQQQFAEVVKIFPHLVDSDILEVVNDVTFEHILNYTCLLRPYISKLISAIEAEAQLKQQELNDHVILCDNLQKELDLLNRENEFLNMENQQYVNNYKQNEVIHQEIKQKTAECYKKLQDLGNQLYLERNANEDAKEIAIIKKRKLEETKLFYEEANQFYDVDIEFGKECAEIRLQSLQDSWEERQAIVKMNENFLNQNREQIDLQKKEIEDFVFNVMNMLDGDDLEDFNENFNVVF